jgi:hypothetical protein
VAAFDWYQGTVSAGVDDVVEALMGLAERADLKHFKGLQGYATRTMVMDDGETVGQVWHGGSHPLPHVVFTSDAAVAGAELIRAKFEHTVTRLDAKEDFGDEGAFDRILPALLEAARKHRVKVDTRGDHLLRKEARTVYLGAKSSAVQCRQYDKAAELRSQFAHEPAKLLEVPQHLTRLEVQVRPQTHAVRQSFAAISPMEAMGCSQWMRDIWNDIAGLELEPVKVTKPWRSSDDDRAYAYLLGAFGGLLTRRMGDHGSWAALGMQLGDDIAARVAADRRLKGGT